MMRILSALLLIASCFGQGNQNVVWTGTVDARGANFQPPTSTFASPPASPTTGSVYTFTDSAAGGCLGTGTYVVRCRWNGSTWDFVGGNGIPGMIVIPAALGNDSTDATATIQAALNSTAGTVFIPPGTYRHSDLTMPGGKTLMCGGNVTNGSDLGGPTAYITLLKYTGSGNGITRAWANGLGDKFSVIGCNFRKSGTLGGNAIDIESGNDFYIAADTFSNFTTGVMLNGQTNGVYFSTIERVVCDTVTVCIDSTDNGAGQTVNAISIRDSRVAHTNIGVRVCSGCINFVIERFDDEFPTGTTPRQVVILGKGNTVRNTWFEPNNATPPAGTIGLLVSQTNNTIEDNIFITPDGGNWTNYSIVAGNTVKNYYDNSTGVLTQSVSFPGTAKFTALGTVTNCSSAASPAVCGSAAGGNVVVAFGTTTVTVNTTAVTANSQIGLTYDSSLSSKLGVTCNTTIPVFGVSARTPATSFVITLTVAPITNPACFSYSIIN